YNHQVWNDTEGFRAILFVDFVRPLMFPFNFINDFLLKVAGDADFMKEADKKQKNWEKKFYKK
ncbi:MAG: aspartyl/asparaginyl beta-hydroxylase domain-containing protein, partial [Thermodesulfobacteriota bacterium]